MNQNNVVCDLFIGKGAGKKVLSEIESAKKSVKIISPYLSASLIFKLLRLYKKGIDVQLVTTDAIMENTEHYAATFRHLISENKIIDKKAKAIRFVLFIISILIWLGALALIAKALTEDNKESTDFLFLIGGIALTLILGIGLQFKIAKLKTFKYHYRSAFPLKFLIAPENANFPIKTFIHSKVYIIDEEIMYWGSLNFTAMGLQDNYETRVRTTDTTTIKKMSKEFDTLMNSKKLPERHLSVWGQQIYRKKKSK